MINPFIIDPKSRLAAWKQVRIDVQKSNNIEEKINVALKFWRMAPLENPILDWDDSSKWPTPWELIHNNHFCDSTLSLALAYTLVLSDPESFSDIKLLLITDRLNHIQKIIVKTNNIILNYGWLDSSPSTILSTVNIHDMWKFDGKKWYNYNNQQSF